MNKALVAPGWLTHRREYLSMWLTPSLRHVDVWSVAPAAALVFVPIPQADRRHGRAFLAVTALIYAALVIGTAPNEGGAQWGPRYLLFAYIPLAVIVSDVVSWLSARRRFVAVAVAVILVSVWVDRVAYKNLRTSKVIYARVVAFVEQQSARNVPVVTDLWWLDQVAARLTTTRTFLYGPDDPSRHMIVKTLSDQGVHEAVLIFSRNESPSVPSEWLVGSCYAITSTNDLVDRQMRAVHIALDCARSRPDRH